MIDVEDIKPGTVIEIPLNFKSHNFSNLVPGSLVLIYYVNKFLCSGIDMKRSKMMGMDISWDDLKQGVIVDFIPEPEPLFYHWVGEGRTTSSTDAVEIILKKQEYRKKLGLLIAEFYPEYTL